MYRVGCCSTYSNIWIRRRRFGRKEDEVPWILSLMQYSMDPCICTVILSIGWWCLDAHSTARIGINMVRCCRDYQARDFITWAWQDCGDCVCAVCAHFQHSTYSKHRWYIACSSFQSVFSEKCIGWGVVQHIPSYELEEDGLGGRRMMCHESSVWCNIVWIPVSVRSFWV